METTKTQTNGTTVTSELSSMDMLEVLKEKRKAYFRLRYDTDLDYSIAKRLDDEPLKERLLKQLKRIEEAINFINEEIEKIGEKS